MIVNIFFILLNVIFFFNGLLPIRSTTKKNSDVEYSKHKTNNKNFDHTVIMIVDALRKDFVNDDLMPLTTNFIKKYGCLIDVSVASPTVTLPRIKSLITGNVPQFTDIFHNLGSPQVLEDSILHRARKRNRQIVFYGDETWLKILPDDMFLRHGGTTSFYVNDFYEVDDNVTINLDLELQRSDWDIMILHYLGLDHIGHVHGPFSDLVPTKLHEMDVIFSKIFESLTRKNLTSLVILTGDHGMRDTGGHGGSTYSETHVPFGVLGVPCDDGLIEQVDITPNLAVLLNLEIPKTSIGKLTRIILKNLTLDQYLSAVYENAEILSGKNSEGLEDFRFITKLYDTYVEKSGMETTLHLIQLCTEYSQKVSRTLINSSTQQDLVAMVLSVLLLFYSLITHLKGSELFKTTYFNYILYSFLLISRFIFNEIFVLVPALSALGFQVLMWRKVNTRLSVPTVIYILIFIIFFQPLTFLSSSFIEEEHEFWYFFLNTFFVLQIFRMIEKKDVKSLVSWIFVSSAFRFAETLNQMGDKWASMQDTSDFLLKPENYYYHLAFLSCSMFSLYYFCLMSGRKMYHLEKIILLLIFLQKIDVFDSILLAKIIYVLLSLYLVASMDYLNSWIILIALLSKSYNLCLIPLCVYTSHLISNEYKSKLLSTCLHLILSKSLYFMQGNGNNIANIDVSVGYTALSNYNPVLVGTQLIINIYSTTVLIHFLLNLSVNDKKSFNLVFAERLYTTVVVCIVSMIFRNHIFIWSVYAPKLCIECGHTLIFIVEFLVFKLSSSVVNSFSRDKG